MTERFRSGDEPRTIGRSRASVETLDRQTVDLDLTRPNRSSAGRLGAVAARRGSSIARTLPRSFAYHSSLDGVRGLAMLAILAYHLQYHWARGAFLSVDLFFALSGFLITTLLVIEWNRSGTVRLRAFWARRARRLLPALLVTIGAIAVYTHFVVQPWNRPAVRTDALATLTYVANWRFILAHQTYFNLFSAPSPLRHVWTLAVEEQFYLVWPIVAFACLRLGRGSLKYLAAVCSLGTAASVLAMRHAFDQGQDLHAYYGTDARMQAGSSAPSWRSCACGCRPAGSAHDG